LSIAMLVLRDPKLTSQLLNVHIRELVSLRFTQVSNGEPYDYNRHGYMVVVEPGDTVEQLEQETGCGITRDLFDETRYGEADFAPSFEILEEHDVCYEMHFSLNDDGFGITLFILKEEGIPDDLRALCTSYAVPAAPLSTTP
jgi:hypothetical protein